MRKLFILLLLIAVPDCSSKVGQVDPKWPKSVLISCDDKNEHIIKLTEDIKLKDAQNIICQFYNGKYKISTRSMKVREESIKRLNYQKSFMHVDSLRYCPISNKGELLLRHDQLQATILFVFSEGKLSIDTVYSVVRAEFAE